MTAVADHPTANPAHARRLRPFTESQRNRTPLDRRDGYALLCIGILAAITRFIALPHPVSSGTPIFDEKHYVPQAWDIVRSWEHLLIGGIESNPGYGLVVHPPLAKQIIALAEFVFGYSPWGWRAMAAAFGTAVVIVTMLLARELTQSWKVGAFAGIIATFDGVLLVSSRFGMLDIFQVFFIIAAAWMLARDHREMRARMHRAWQTLVDDNITAGNGRTFTSADNPGNNAWNSRFGPRFGVRWWRFGAGIMLGCALAIKWSGLYYIAFFGLFCVLGDLIIRRRYGVTRPYSAVWFRDIPAALASLVAVPVLLYLWSWRAWFTSETAVYRHAAVDGTIEDGSWLHSLPDTVASWLYYHQSVLEFHSTLTSSGGHTHPWDSKPWAWLAGLRPILYYSNTELNCPLGGSEAGCRQMLFLFGTPAIWWLIVPGLLWAVWALVVRGERAFAWPLVGFAAGFIPWLAAYDRQMYFFYAAAFIPFVIVIYAIILGHLAHRGRYVRWRLLVHLTGRELTVGSLVVIVYLATVVGMFIYYSPILYALTITDGWYHSLMWLPSWT